MSRGLDDPAAGDVAAFACACAAPASLTLEGTSTVVGRRRTRRLIEAAYFRPMVEAFSGPSSKGRPSNSAEWAGAATQRAHDRLLERLRAALPDITDEQLSFRVKCVGGVLVLLSTAALESALPDMTLDQIVEVLVPVVAGTLASV